jgi:hypothetical protein
MQSLGKGKKIAGPWIHAAMRWGRLPRPTGAEETLALGRSCQGVTDHRRPTVSRSVNVLVLVQSTCTKDDSHPSRLGSPDQPRVCTHYYVNIGHGTQKRRKLPSYGGTVLPPECVSSPVPKYMYMYFGQRGRRSTSKISARYTRIRRPGRWSGSPALRLSAPTRRGNDHEL